MLPVAYRLYLVNFPSFHYLCYLFCLYPSLSWFLSFYFFMIFAVAQLLNIFLHNLVLYRYFFFYCSYLLPSFIKFSSFFINFFPSPSHFTCISPPWSSHAFVIIHSRPLCFHFIPSFYQVCFSTCAFSSPATSFHSFLFSLHTSWLYLVFLSLH